MNELLKYNIPSGLKLHELYIDARDLQPTKDDGTSVSIDEYAESLRGRGTEKLAENQLVQSFDATIRTLNPTYAFGKDFFLGDTITVTDERLGVTVDTVVTGVQHSVSRAGEELTFTFGHGQPTVYDIIRRKGDK